MTAIRISRRTKITAGIAVLAALVAVFVFASMAHSSEKLTILDPTYSVGGQHLGISASCSTQKTVVTKTNGSNVQFHASVRGKGGTWYPGPNSLTKSTAVLQAPSVPASAHGILVYWSGGSQFYTFC